MVQNILDGEAPVYKSANGKKKSSASNAGDSIGHTLYKHLMNGVSHMLPFVVGGGILIALAFLIDGFSVDLNALSEAERANFGTITPVAAALKGIGGMTPPCAIALATLLFKHKFTEEQRKSGPTNFVMGLSFITEGAIPFAASDPLHVLPSCIVGSALAGALSMAFNCTLMAPHGGIFVFPVVSNPLMYLVALVAGTVASALVLGAIKKPVVEM